MHEDTGHVSTSLSVGWHLATGVTVLVVLSSKDFHERRPQDLLQKEARRRSYGVWSGEECFEGD